MGHNFAGLLEDFLEAFLEAVDVVVDQVLLVNLPLVDEAHEGEALVDFAQIQDDVVLAVGAGKLDDAAGLLVELRTAFFVDAVDAGHVDHHLNQLATNFVVLHVHRVAVRADVDFANDIE